MQRLVVIALGVLLVINITLFSLLGLKLYGRSSHNALYKADAQELLEAAKAWRKDNNSLWPEACLVEPGTAKLCTTGQDRDEIVALANSLDTHYQVFVVEPPSVKKEDSKQGEITSNPLVAYALANNAMIVVNKTICFQERELTESNGFAVIYGRETKNGKVAACV